MATWHAGSDGKKEVQREKGTEGRLWRFAYCGRGGMKSTGVLPCGQTFGKRQRKLKGKGENP